MSNVLKNRRVAMINLGCKVNKYEADAMMDKLQGAGMIIVDSHEVADVYIVNTCSVTNMAERKSRQMLSRARKKNPQAIVVAAGCYVNARHEDLQGREYVDLVVGNNCKKDIVEALTQYFTNTDERDYYIDINHTREYEEMGSLESSVMQHQRAYIKIQDGCNQFCSYCIIPYTRGRVRSRRPDKILAEITRLAGEGIKEFVLTGIHISSYGTDFVDENMDLGWLVHEIEQVPEVARIRLGSLEPRIITRKFLEQIGESEKLCPHFHLSLQSACNDTLCRMNRKYTIEEFEEKCEIIRKYFDLPAITTDVIVGFPGETEEEFSTTLENLKRLNLYEIHVFKYSVRSGTVAEKMPNQVPEEKKAARSDVLLSLTAKQKDAYEKSLAGIKDEVLIEEQTGTTEDGIGIYAGHTKRYVKMDIQSGKSLVNEIVPVQL